MRPRLPPLPRQTLPPDILPPDFVARHNLIERLILDPLRHRVRVRAWAPLLGRSEVAELARRLKMHTAMPAPSCTLPDRGLSEIYGPVLRAIHAKLIATTDWLPPRSTWRLMLSMTELIHGKRTLRRIREPA